MMSSFQLSGRVALVTGSARGLGRAIAVGLAEAGADLVLADRQSQEESEAAIERAGRRSCLITADVGAGGGEMASRVIDEAIEAMGRLDILVNNAGVIRRAPAADYTEGDWQEVLDTNLSSAFYLSQAAARRWMTAGSGGKIINLASMLSFQGGFQVAAYTASKSGIVGLTRALSNEWARHRINVNAIAPGYMATEVTRSLREHPERSRAILDRIPAGRWGEPEELKGAAVFLASDAASYVHGAVLAVDGGWLAW